MLRVVQLLRAIWARVPSPPKSMEELRQLVVNLFVTIAVCAVAFVTIAALFDRTTVVEPVSVPKSLADAGYSGSAVAQSIVDKILVISQKAKADLQRSRFAGESKFADASSISMPSSNLSIGTLVSLLRAVLPLPQQGAKADLALPKEIKGASGKAYHLTLRMTQDGKRGVREIESDSLDELCQRAAEEIVEALDPYVFAWYLYGTSGGDDFHQPVPRLDKVLARLIEENDPAALPYVLNLQAMVQGRLGQFDAAIATYARATQLLPKAGFIYDNWASTLDDKGDRKGALAMYAKAAALEPNNADIHYNWGCTLMDIGENAEAAKKFERAVALNPKYQNAWVNWGVVLAALGDKDEAIKKYRRAAELDPKDAENYDDWGLALFDKGDKDGAIEKYRKAIEVDAKYLDAYRDLARALDAKGEHAEADKVRARAQELGAMAKK